MAKSYRVLRDLRYPDGPAEVAKRKAKDPDVRWKEVPEGAIATDIPPESISWLLEQGRIEEVKTGAPSPTKVKEADDG
jgi:hypothetical protein